MFILVMISQGVIANENDLNLEKPIDNPVPFPPDEDKIRDGVRKITTTEEQEQAQILFGHDPAQ